MFQSKDARSAEIPPFQSKRLPDFMIEPSHGISLETEQLLIILIIYI